MSDRLPEDLFLPCTCPACGAQVDPPFETVLLAGTTGQPIDCGTPGCIAQLHVTDITQMAFFSRAEWDAWDDSDPDAEHPPHYHAAVLGEVEIRLPPMSMN